VWEKKSFFNIMVLDWISTEREGAKMKKRDASYCIPSLWVFTSAFNVFHLLQLVRRILLQSDTEKATGGVEFTWTTAIFLSLTLTLCVDASAEKTFISFSIVPGFFFNLILEFIFPILCEEFHPPPLFTHPQDLSLSPSEQEEEEERAKRFYFGKEFKKLFLNIFFLLRFLEKQFSYHVLEFS
jgi:hypothetical protein